MGDAGFMPELVSVLGASKSPAAREMAAESRPGVRAPQLEAVRPGGPRRGAGAAAAGTQRGEAHAGKAVPAVD
jgi:hypothetical protein